MSEQLPLFTEPKPPPKLKGGSFPRGAHRLFMALQRQGLSPGARVAAARLVALLDSEPARDRR